jgi:TRAP transporter 4TM/12TM fusion protein
VFTSLFTLYIILLGQLTAQTQLGIFLLASGLAVFCLKPFHPGWAASGRPALEWANRLLNLLIISLFVFAGVYLLVNYFEISSTREGIPTTWDLVCYTLGTLTVLEGVRRTDGWPLLSVILLLLAYLVWGHHIPGTFGHHPLSLAKIAEVSFSLNGVFGVALAVVADVVFIFILFGAIMRVTGAGALFIDLAYMLTGRYPGGPAQSAVVASALFGSISGSGPANVVSTGSFTIPLMKRVGYRPEFAAAVEATASCVGQIMPPVMGVGAFIMAEITGIDYGRIMLAAVVPSLLYSFSLLVSVRLRARRRNLPTLRPEEIPRFTREMVPRLAVLAAAIGTIILVILSGRTPAYAGLAGCLVLLAGACLVRPMRPDGPRLLAMLREGGRDGVGMIVSCAGIGIIIGGISATGLGIKFTQAIVGLGQERLVLALIMAAFCCLIIGMALPTAASYLMVVYVAAPAIVELGLPTLTAHMFIFYYAVLSAITPPVAVCAYAAAGIAQSSYLKTGVMAVRLGAIGFVLPFLWIYNPELLLAGTAPLEAAWVIGACALGVVALAAANIGFLRRPLRLWERGLCLAAACGLFVDVHAIRLAALAAGAALFVLILKPDTSPGPPIQAG